MRVVELDDAGCIAGPGGSVHVRLDRFQPGEQLRRGDGAPGAAHLQPAAQRQHLDGGVGVERRDRGPAVAFAQDEAILLKTQQGLADSALAAAHFLGDAKFGQGGLGPQLVEQDPPLQRRIDDFALPHVPSLSQYQYRYWRTLLLSIEPMRRFDATAREAAGALTC